MDGRSQIAGIASIGTVTDSTGAVIPKAPVTVVEVTTQVKHTTVGGLMVAAPGFKTDTQREKSNDESS